MATGDAWKDEIEDKLMSLFENKPETLSRVLFYMTKEDETYRDGTDLPPVWRTLKRAMSSESTFKLYAERLAEDTKVAETDVEYRKFMDYFYKQIINPSDNPLSKDAHQGYELALAPQNLSCGIGGFARAWTRIPPAGQIQIIEMLPSIIINKQLVGLEKTGALANKVGGTVIMVTLAAIQLSYEAIVSIIRWYKGEITGVRCVKNIVDSTASIAGGIGGGYLGVAAGAALAPVLAPALVPIGLVAGGFIGGIVGSTLAETLSNILTQKIFGLPKEEALENAYNFFGVKMTASNNEINISYKKLCLQHHPDKGGREEKFIEVQVNLAVIKAARKEL